MTTAGNFAYAQAAQPETLNFTFAQQEGLTLNPNHGIRTLLNLTLTLLTLLTLIGSPQTLVYRYNSHFQCYCSGIYRRKRFIQNEK